MATLPETKTPKRHAYLASSRAFLWGRAALVVLGAWALLSGCDQPVAAQTLPVMDAAQPSGDAGSTVPEISTDAQDNTLPNLGGSDVGLPNSSPPDIEAPGIEVPDLSPPSPETPTPGAPSPSTSPLPDNSPDQTSGESPESDNTRPAGDPALRRGPDGAETPETHPAPARGSGQNTPPEFMIRKRPQKA